MQHVDQSTGRQSRFSKGCARVKINSSSRCSKAYYYVTPKPLSCLWNLMSWRYPAVLMARDHSSNRFRQKDSPQILIATGLPFYSAGYPSPSCTIIFNYLGQFCWPFECSLSDCWSSFCHPGRTASCCPYSIGRSNAKAVSNLGSTQSLPRSVHSSFA